MSRWIEPFFRWLKRIEPWFFKYDWKTWALFQRYDLQRIEPFWKMWLIGIDLWSMIQRIELLFFFWKRLTEPRIDFLQFDSNTWTWLKTLNLFFNITQRIEFFFLDMTHKTQRSKLFLKNDSRNLFFPWLKELNLFRIWLDFFLKKYFLTQRIELLSWLRIELFYDSKNWAFFFFRMTQRIELLKYDSKN